MKRKIIILIMSILYSNLFSQEIIFKLNKDVVAKGGNIDSPEFSLDEGTIVSVDNDNDFYINDLNGEPFYSIKGNVDGYKLYFNGNDLLFTEYPNFVVENDNRLWCMAYYYDALKSRNLNIIKNNDVITKADREDTLLFHPLYFMLGNTYVAGQSSALLGDFNAISRIESKTEDKIVFVIMFKDCGFKQIEETFRWDKHYKRLYESKTPYKIIFKIDGDFANIYINSISESNFLFTLARTDKNTLNEITRFVKTGNFNSSKIKWPKNCTDKTFSLPTNLNTNVTANKVMSVSENLKLRSAEATTSNVLTVMSAGTKVKILEIGKQETIDGINSNWVKVEVISGKDRDGKQIKNGSKGWCYGGYLE